MKLLTSNFLTCAVKSCKTSPLSFPLRFRDCVLESVGLAYDPRFILNVLPRVEWHAFLSTCSSLSLPLPPAPPLPETKPEGLTAEGDEALLRRLHHLLLEVEVVEGVLACGNCGHGYAVKEGIPNFLLPSHLV